MALVMGWHSLFSRSAKNVFPISTNVILNWVNMSRSSSKIILYLKPGSFYFLEHRFASPNLRKQDGTCFDKSPNLDHFRQKHVKDYKRINKGFNLCSKFLEDLLFSFHKRSSRHSSMVSTAACYRGSNPGKGENLLISE